MKLLQWYAAVFVFAERHMRGLWLLALAVVSTWAVVTYRAEPWLSYQNIPFDVKVRMVHPGDAVPLRVIRCNSSREEQFYTIQRWLENVVTSRQYPLSDSIIKLKPGCVDEVRFDSVIPSEGIPYGRYRVVGLSLVQSEFRIHFVGWQSQEFEVMP